MNNTFVNYIGHNRTVMFEKYETDEQGIALILKLMETHPLAPHLEDTFGYSPTWLDPEGDHAKERAGVKSYLGNFHRVSCVFNIDTRDPELIAKLDAAIAKNMATPEYQAAKAEWLEYQAKREEQRRERFNMKAAKEKGWTDQQTQGAA